MSRSRRATGGLSRPLRRSFLMSCCDDRLNLPTLGFRTVDDLDRRVPAGEMMPDIYETEIQLVHKMFESEDRSDGKYRQAT